MGQSFGEVMEVTGKTLRVSLLSFLQRDLFLIEKLFSQMVKKKKRIMTGYIMKSKFPSDSNSSSTSQSSLVVSCVQFHIQSIPVEVQVLLCPSTCQLTLHPALEPLLHPAKCLGDGALGPHIALPFRSQAAWESTKWVYHNQFNQFTNTDGQAFLC